MMSSFGQCGLEISSGSNADEFRAMAVFCDDERLTHVHGLQGGGIENGKEIFSDSRV